MPHLQRFATSLLAVAALIAAVTLAAAPASGQEGVTVFVIGNDMVNDRAKEERWQIQVSARPVGGCTPTKGNAEYFSPWINAGAEVAAELSLGECVFRISVAMRQASNPANCWYTAALKWGERDSTETPVDNAVFTSDRPTGVSRISAVRKPTSHCAFPWETRYYINGSEIVEDLPGPSADADLLALARRAAEIAEFKVRIEPDRSAGAVNPGCDRTGTITVRGDGRRVRHSLEATGGPCEFKASIVKASAPFEALQDRIVTFSDNARNVNLTSLVHLPQARIAIIQNAQGTANQGTASYTVARSCGNHAVTTPAAALRSTPLQDGRYTVHAPHLPSFGATSVYPAVAAGTDAARIVGCSVRVVAVELPVGCIVSGDPSQTLTWTEANPIRRFDFEFDIRCGAAATSIGTVTTTTTTTATAPRPTTTTAAEVAEDMFEISDPEPEPAPEKPPAGPRFDMPTG